MIIIKGIESRKYKIPPVNFEILNQCLSITGTQKKTWCLSLNWNSDQLTIFNRDVNPAVERTLIHDIGTMPISDVDSMFVLTNNVLSSQC